jgi:hypothetical protein
MMITVGVAVMVMTWPGAGVGMVRIVGRGVSVGLDGAALV